MNIKDMFSMAKQAAGLQKNLKKIQAELKSKTAEFTAAGGKVKAVARGDGTILKISIAPDLLNPAHADTLEKAVLTAVQGAIDSAKNEGQAALKRMAAEMGLPEDMMG